MFADLVYRIDGGMTLRVFKRQKDALDEFPFSQLLHAVDLTAEQIVELTVVQKLVPKEVDGNGRYVNQ